MTISAIHIRPVLFDTLAALWGRKAKQAGAEPPLSARERDEALRDSRLPPEDLTGARPDPDLPFFMRPGFGERS